jgi:hypothetical protein
VSESLVPLGRNREPSDGCRRYLPIVVTFDTRNLVLDLDIQDDWDEQVKASWKVNKAQVREELRAEFGTVDAEAKLDNYRAMGPAPWSIVFEHSLLLRQVRNAFAHGDFYPALVGASALGERLLHQVVHALRGDYINHLATTKAVKSGKLKNEWGSLIDVLHGWSVLDDETADAYRDLENRRHGAVHFDPRPEAVGREAALAALLDLQQIVERVFAPHGGPPRYIGGISGNSYLSLEAEHEPIVRRIFIPNCALVSPAHRMEPDESFPGGWRVYDDDDRDCAELSDKEFAARIEARGQ